MFQLAELYDTGLGVKQSKGTALGWFNQAALVMQMRNSVPYQTPAAGDFSEMSTWSGLDSMARRLGGGAGQGSGAEEGAGEEDDEATAERDKFEAWCQMSTPRQIALFYKIQADLDAGR